MEIKVLGTGCATCKKLHKAAQEAVAETGAGAEVVYVTDMEEIMKLGVMSTPALIVDGTVKAMGRASKKKEIIAIIRDSM